MGDVDIAVEYLNRCIRDCLYRGESPYASHKMLVDALDDNIMSDRAIGIDAGYAWYSEAEYIIFYTDLGWSLGMLEAWAFAARRNKNRILRSLNGAVSPPPENIHDRKA
jgi:hypothetical protein